MLVPSLQFPAHLCTCKRRGHRAKDCEDTPTKAYYRIPPSLSPTYAIKLKVLLPLTRLNILSLECYWLQECCTVTHIHVVHHCTCQYFSPYCISMACACSPSNPCPCMLLFHPPSCMSMACPCSPCHGNQPLSLHVMGQARASQHSCYTGADLYIFIWQ